MKTYVGHITLLKNAGEFFLLLVMTSCIEPFDVIYENDTSNVVITGSITDLAPARVEITSPAETNHTRVSSIRKVTGAAVTLSDDLGFQEVLQEISDGIYQGVTKGIEGRSYHIEVTLPDDSQIKSTPQLLKPCPSIDNLELEHVSFRNPISENTKVEVIGLNLNVHMNSPNTGTRYFKWTIGGTYEMYTALNQGEGYPPPCDLPVTNHENTRPCYVTTQDKTLIILGESVSNDSDILSKTLKVITPNSTYKYGQSVEVSQYSMTKDAFDYWSKVEGQQKGVGSVFDPPPAQIIGNLSYAEDQGTQVMGYFEVSSVKKRRVFIQATDFEGLDSSSVFFSDKGINEPCWPPIGWQAPTWTRPDYCCDCRLLDNSTKTKPSDWPN
jgi:hypothetical protein